MSADSSVKANVGPTPDPGQDPVLFLDYDGVLHPDEVYLERGRPVLRARGELFIWVPLLEAALAPHPRVRIVLSTSWARELRFATARDRLPPGLRARVIGATWHSTMGRVDGISLGRTTWWDQATRYEQIRRYVNRAGLRAWVAIDDRPEGWAEADRGCLVRTHSSRGLSEMRVMDELAGQLERICKHGRDES